MNFLNTSASPSLLVGRKEKPWFEALLLTLLVGYAVVFLAVHKATNTCFFLLIFMAAIHYFLNKPLYREMRVSMDKRWLFWALASPFIAVVAGKLLRSEFSYRDLDAESRYLLAVFLLNFFLIKRIRFSSLLEAALPAALILTLVVIWLNPDYAARWGGRFATSFVDPNALGSYATILSFMVLMALDPGEPRPAALQWLKYAGIGAGLLLSLLAASRGGWSAIPPLFALWLYFRFRGGVKRVAYPLLLVVVVIAAGVHLLPGVKDRMVAPVSEVQSWVTGAQKATSPGARLSIWKLNVHLIAQKPLSGWGIPGMRAELKNPEINAWADPWVQEAMAQSSDGGYGGPHNDLLQMAVQSGVFGIAAYAMLLFVPLVFFWRRRLRAENQDRLPCELGICLIVGVAVCGLTNEMLSLKYLASFLGITLAGLAAQVLMQADAGRRS